MNPTVVMKKGGDVIYVPAELQGSFERDGYTLVKPEAPAVKKENN